VLADFVEDLQFYNVEGGLGLYLTGQSSTGKKIDIFTPWSGDPKKIKHGSIGTIKYEMYLDDPAITTASNGLIYMIGSRDENIYVINPESKLHVDTISMKYYIRHLGGHPAITSGPNDMLYVYAGGYMYAVNYKTKKSLPEVFTGRLGSYSSMTFGVDGLIYILSSGSNSRYIYQIDPKTRKLITSIPSGIYWSSLKNNSIVAGDDGLLYFIGNGADSRNIRVYDPVKKITTLIPTGINIYHPDMIWGGDGLLYLTGTNSGGSGGVFIKIIDTIKKKAFADINTRLTLHYPVLAHKSTKTGQEALVNIKLTLRSKNKQHTADKTYTKEVDEEHHIGNYNFEFNDKYKRDVFFSTVAVRNMLL
jgi:hypothetical protein